MALNPRAVLVQGLGYGALSLATLGWITPGELIVPSQIATVEIIATEQTSVATAAAGRASVAIAARRLTGCATDAVAACSVATGSSASTQAALAATSIHSVALSSSQAHRVALSVEALHGAAVGEQSPAMAVDASEPDLDAAGAVKTKVTS